MDFKEKTYEGLPAAVGLAFAMYEECGLAALVDEAAGYEGGRLLSPGAAVKALIGPMMSPSKKIAVCRLEDFYRPAPADVVFGGGVTHESLNDRAVGEVLDLLAEADLQDLLWRCAARCRERYGLSSDVYHMDATNFPVYALSGKYDPEEGAVVPAYGGNSKNGRNDLMQYDAEVVSDGNRTVTYLRAYSGNTADTTMNADTIRFLKDRIDCGRSTIVADCKLVTKDLIGMLVSSGLGFVSKCPENFSNTVRAEVIASALNGSMRGSSLGEGYAYCDTEADTVCGRLRFIAYRTPIDKDMSVKYHREEGERQLQRIFGPLQRAEFDCIPDAESAFRRALRTEDHGYTVAAQIVERTERVKRSKRGRPPKGEPPEYRTSYALSVSWNFDEEKARKISEEGNVRVLVTNLPSDTHRRGNLREGATSDDVIAAYLDEYKPEHCFRLLKSGLGMSKVYLHKPCREKAMMTVLGIAAVITTVIDCVFRAKEPGLTFLNAAWMVYGASVRYKRTSGYRYVDGPEDSGPVLQHLCELLNLEPDLMIGLK